MMNELRRRRQSLNLQDFGSAGRRRGFVKLQRATIKIRKRMEELRTNVPLRMPAIVNKSDVLHGRNC